MRVQERQSIKTGSNEEPVEPQGQEHQNSNDVRDRPLLHDICRLYLRTYGAPNCFASRNGNGRS